MFEKDEHLPAASETLLQEAERLAALFKEGAPNLHKEEGPQKDLRVRQIIRERWSQLKALLLRKG